MNRNRFLNSFDFTNPAIQNITQRAILDSQKKKYLFVCFHSFPGKPPAITLSNNCTGKVLINKEHVSASQWLDKMSDNLCNNLGCGNAIQHWSVKTDTKKCWHFSCTGLETSVWQCGSKKDNCENILSVACKSESYT